MIHVEYGKNDLQSQDRRGEDNHHHNPANLGSQSHSYSISFKDALCLSLGVGTRRCFWFARQLYSMFMCFFFVAYLDLSLIHI